MTSPPAYTFQFADLATGVILDELPLTNVRYNQKLNTAGTLSAVLTITDPRVRGRDPYDLTTPTRRVVYVLRDGRPVWGGIIWTRRYDSASGQVSIGAADWWSYFDHRKILPLLPERPPVDYVARQSVSYRDVEQNEIVRRVVQLAQQHAGGNILVEAETTSSGTWRDRTWYGYALASVGEELRRLSSVIGGPDMLFTVAEGPAGRPRRVLRIGTPYLGQQGSPWVWQYGGNVRAYRWDSDGSRSARRVFATGDGMEQGTPIAVAEDRDALTAWPLLETERGYSSVRETATLQSHADADQAAARLPVVTIQLTVDGTRYPQVGVWAVGDDSRVVIDDEFHQRRPGRDHGLDTTVRIIGADISVTEQGEDVTLTMAPLLEDVA